MLPCYRLERIYAFTSAYHALCCCDQAFLLHLLRTLQCNLLFLFQIDNYFLRKTLTIKTEKQAFHIYANVFPLFFISLERSLFQFGSIQIFLSISSKRTDRNKFSKLLIAINCLNVIEIERKGNGGMRHKQIFTHKKTLSHYIYKFQEVLRSVDLYLLTKSGKALDIIL